MTDNYYAAYYINKNCYCVMTDFPNGITSEIIRTGITTLEKAEQIAKQLNEDQSHRIKPRGHRNTDK